MAVTDSSIAAAPSASAGVRIVARDLAIAYPLKLANTRTPGADGEHLALNGVSFSLAPGDRLGLLGRNGSGKSTLLRTLAGVFPPTGGVLEVGGSVSAIFNSSLGFVQEATGMENIFLRGAMLGLNFRQIEALIPEIVDFSELGAWIDQPIRRYSSGMALRLAFSITTAVRTDIVLLDEWLGAGDADFLKKARARMQDMVGSARIVVLATHNLNLMRAQCTQAMVLDDGRIAYMGEIEEAIALYTDLRKSTQL